MIDWDLLLAGTPLSLTELEKIGFVRSVCEPEYSRQMLLAFERKYGISSVEVLDGAGTARVPATDLAEWRWNLDIYLESGGSLDDIVLRKECKRWVPRRILSSFLGVFRRR